MLTNRPYLNAVVPKICVSYYLSIYILIFHTFSSYERAMSWFRQLVMGL